MGGLRKLKRDKARAEMKRVGIVQPNKTKQKTIDSKGNPAVNVHKSFFSMHWREGC